MAGIPFLSKIAALEGLLFRKNSSNREALVELSSFQPPNSSISINLPYKDGTLLLSPGSEGVVGQALISDGDGTTSWADFPTDSVTSVNGETGAVVLDAADVGAIPTSEKGAANGVASLGADGIVPDSQLPPIPGIAAPLDFYGSVISSQTSGEIFSLSSKVYRGFIAQISIFIDAATDLSETYLIIGSNNGTTWSIGPVAAGNTSGVSLSISSSGVLSFSDPAAQEKTISYTVQAIDNSLAACCSKKESGQSTSSDTSGDVFTISSTLYKSFLAYVTVFIDAATDLAETFVILGANNGSDWIITQRSVGDSTGVSFSISAGGVLSFSDPAGQAKTISWQYEAVNSLTGKATSNASSGAIATIQPSLFRSFNAQVCVLVDAASDLAETFQLVAVNTGSDWLMSANSAGQDTDVDFSISSSGVLSFSDPTGQSKQISFRISTVSI
jgi:hypothetical protein